MSRLGNLCDLLVSDMGIECCDQRSELLTSSLIRPSLASMPLTQCSSNEMQASLSSLCRL